MDEKIEVNDKTVIDLAKIIHKHNQYIQADWEEYTKSDVALAYAIKWNGYRKESDTAREIFEKIFEVLCCFTTQGKSREYAEGFIDCLEEVDKRLQTLAKEKYGVDLGE